MVSTSALAPDTCSKLFQFIFDNPSLLELFRNKDLALEELWSRTDPPHPLIQKIVENEPLFKQILEACLSLRSSLDSDADSDADATLPR